MRQIKLYIATSLDGYIATPDGGVEWLTQFPNTTNDDYKYNKQTDILKMKIKSK